jgi:predicted O-linked N-acetylglucosamine transferase (SPINDLY family)
MARFALADLFLDTSPYNAGTVASDALRMGLPLVTLSGRAFASRMAGSLLRAIGLHDGITTDLDSYINRATAFGADPALHARARAVLAGEAWRTSIGDSAGFTSRLESVLRAIRLLA